MSDWQPIETAPDNGLVLAYWPALQVDENGDLTDRPHPTQQGFIGVADRLGGQWNGEPETLNYAGPNYFGDDFEYAPDPTHWQPLPEGPK